MKQHSILLVLALLLIPATVVEAQSSNSKPRFNHKLKIESIYDQSRDVTVVKVMLPLLPLNYRDYENRYVTLTAGFYFNGKAISSTTPTFQLNLLSSAITGFKFDKERHFSVLPDKEKTPQVLGECQRMKVSQRPSGMNSPGQPGVTLFNEMLAIDLTREQFLKITEPKNVTLRFGNESFFLSTEGLEALRDLAYRAAH